MSPFEHINCARYLFGFVFEAKMSSSILFSFKRRFEPLTHNCPVHNFKNNWLNAFHAKSRVPRTLAACTLYTHHSTIESVIQWLHMRFDVVVDIIISCIINTYSTTIYLMLPDTLRQSVVVHRYYTSHYYVFFYYYYNQRIRGQCWKFVTHVFVSNVYLYTPRWRMYYYL